MVCLKSAALADGMMMIDVWPYLKLEDVPADQRKNVCDFFEGLERCDEIVKHEA